MQELRPRLRMRQDGFRLSKELPGFLGSFDEANIVHVKHLEALARMTLFFDFEVRSEQASERAGLGNADGNQGALRSLWHFSNPRCSPRPDPLCS